MLAAELVALGTIELKDVPIPEPGPGELVVRVDAALTCGTDLKTFQRGHPKFPLPTPLGHEVSGTVAAARDVPGFHEGDAIACVPTAPCGECRLCRRGRENLCAQAVGRMLLGAFAEYVRVPAHIVRTNVFPRPKELSGQEAAALEPLACVVHGASRVRAGEAETIVVVGDGAIALLFVALLRARADCAGAKILVLGHHADRLRVAAAYGANSLDCGDWARAREHVMDWTDGQGADLVVECVGRPEIWENAATLAGPAAEVLLFGGCAAGTRASFDTYASHYQEIDLKGAFHYTRADVRAALELLSSGRVSVKPLITHERKLEQLHDAFDLVQRRVAIKVAVIP